MMAIEQDDCREGNREEIKTKPRRGRAWEWGAGQGSTARKRKGAAMESGSVESGVGKREAIAAAKEGMEWKGE